MEGLRVGWEKPRPIRDRVRERAQVQHGKQAQAGTSLPTKLTTLGVGYSILATPNAFALVGDLKERAETSLWL